MPMADSNLKKQKEIKTWVFHHLLFCAFDNDTSWSIDNDVFHLK